MDKTYIKAKWLYILGLVIAEEKRRKNNDNRTV